MSNTKCPFDKFNEAMIKNISNLSSQQSEEYADQSNSNDDSIHVSDDNNNNDCVSQIQIQIKKENDQLMIDLEQLQRQIQQTDNETLDIKLAMETRTRNRNLSQIEANSNSNQIISNNDGDNDDDNAIEEKSLILKQNLLQIRIKDKKQLFDSLFKKKQSIFQLQNQTHEETLKQHAEKSQILNSLQHKNDGATASMRDMEIENLLLQKDMAHKVDYLEELKKKSSDLRTCLEAEDKADEERNLQGIKDQALMQDLDDLADELKVKINILRNKNKQQSQFNNSPSQENKEKVGECLQKDIFSSFLNDNSNKPISTQYQQSVSDGNQYEYDTSSSFLDVAQIKQDNEESQNNLLIEVNRLKKQVRLQEYYLDVCRKDKRDLLRSVYLIN